MVDPDYTESQGSPSQPPLSLKYRFARSSIAFASRLMGGERSAIRVARQQPVIITYHNLTDRGPVPIRMLTGQDLPVETFVAQIRILQSILPISDPRDLLKDVPAPGIYLSFDDGMLNGFTLVRQVLQSLGVRAIFSVCPDLVSGEISYYWRDFFFLRAYFRPNERIQLPWGPCPTGEEIIVGQELYQRQLWDWVLQGGPGGQNEFIYPNSEIVAEIDSTVRDHPELAPRLKTMNWDQVRTLDSEGHLIASHSCAHRILKPLNFDYVENDLRESRLKLDTALGKASEMIVYPYGNSVTVDRRTVEAARSAGFTRGMTNTSWTIFPDLGLLAMPRIRLGTSASRDEIISTINGYFWRAQRLREQIAFLWS